MLTTRSDRGRRWPAGPTREDTLSLLAGTFLHSMFYWQEVFHRRGV